MGRLGSTAGRAAILPPSPPPLPPPPPRPCCQPLSAFHPTAAWRTGLTLENVLLRLDAFEHLQLPVELLHGSIGRIQAQVRWCRRRGVALPLMATLAPVACTKRCMRLLLHRSLPGISG